MSKKSIIAVGAVGLMAVVAAVVLPNLPRARTDRNSNACVNNLRWIDGATQQWAVENGKTTNDLPIWSDVRPYLSRDGKMPTCPRGGRYALGRRDKPPTCSYPGHVLSQ